MTPGLAGLAPTPRKRALLSFRALNSLKNVFGAKPAASLTVRTASSSSVARVTAVTLTGSVCGSAGSFCAVTVIGGTVNLIAGCAPASDAASSTSRLKAPETRLKGNIHEFSHKVLVI